MHSAFRSQSLYSGWFHQGCQPHWVLEVSLLSSSPISSFTLAKWSSVLSSQRQYLIQPRGRKYSCKIYISSTFLAVQDQFTTNILIGMPTNKIQKICKDRIQEQTRGDHSLQIIGGKSAGLIHVISLYAGAYRPISVRLAVPISPQFHRKKPSSVWTIAPLALPDDDQRPKPRISFWYLAKKRRSC